LDANELIRRHDLPMTVLPGNPLGAGKHWGLFKVDRTAKEAMT